MSGADDQATLQQLNITLQKSLKRLERSVSGDPDNNMPSMRQAIQDAVEDFKEESKKLRAEIINVATAASDRLPHRAEWCNSDVLTVASA